MRIGIWFYHLLLSNFCCIVVYQFVIRPYVAPPIAIFKPMMSGERRELRVESSGFRVQRREYREEGAGEGVQIRACR